MRRSSKLASAAAPIAVAIIVALAAPARAEPAAACEEIGSSASRDCTANTESGRHGGSPASSLGAGPSTAAADRVDAAAAGQADAAARFERIALGQGTMAPRRAPRVTQCRCPRTGPEPE